MVALKVVRMLGLLGVEYHFRVLWCNRFRFGSLKGGPHAWGVGLKTEPSRQEVRVLGLRV